MNLSIPEVIGFDRWWRWQGRLLGCAVGGGSLLVLVLAELVLHRGVEVGVGMVLGGALFWWLAAWRERHKRPEA